MLALLLLLLLQPTAALMPQPMQRASSRRAVLGAAALFNPLTQLSHPLLAYAASKNQAETKLEALLEKKVKEKEAQLGFTLDADDIKDVENILRNKYCGPQGAFSGEPGGTCAESPPASATCFRTGYSSSSINSFGGGDACK
jgi:hypothetical protein